MSLMSIFRSGVSRRPAANGSRRVARSLGWARAFASCRRGAAAVEFALVAPTLFLVILGLCEFGIFAWNQHSLEFATEETARVVMTKTAVTDGDVAAELKARVSGIASAELETSVSQEIVGTTTFVTLSVAYTYKFFLLGSLVGLEPMVLKSQTRVPLRASS
jgi:Flp pilus assembly protein TadG